MQRIETDLPGVLVVEPDVYVDTRGFFLESYHERKYAGLGVTGRFVQDNHSRSTRGTLRGLHYQLNRPQAKLCRVVLGEVLDVAVDIRRGSPTFGRWVGVVLSAENQRQVYIPRGFAHGFLVLSDAAEFPISAMSSIARRTSGALRGTTRGSGSIGAFTRRSFPRRTGRIRCWTPSRESCCRPTCRSPRRACVILPTAAGGAASRCERYVIASHPRRGSLSLAAPRALSGPAEVRFLLFLSRSMRKKVVDRDDLL
jgi:dTDP-4-dehydrorhamnose 3,5-epimerase